MTTCAIIPAVGGPELPPLDKLRDALEARMWFCEWAIPARAEAVAFPAEDVPELVAILNAWIEKANTWRADPKATPPAVEVHTGRHHQHVAFTWPDLMLYSARDCCITCFEMDGRPQIEGGKLQPVSVGDVKRVTVVYWDRDAKA